MKIFIILYLCPLFAISQISQSLGTNSEQSLFKNQIDLDIYPLGIESSYKKRIKPSLFLGLGLGTTMIRSNIFDFFNAYGEIFRIRPFLDFQLTRNLHIETGLTGGLTMAFDEDDIGYTIGTEIGVFLRTWKVDLGIRPSLLFYKSNDGGNFDSPKLTTSLFIIKIPLNRW